MRQNAATAMKISYIRRDPFARATLMREYDPANKDMGTCYKTCSWCGNAPGKYRYTWDEDDNPRRVEFWGHQRFCSISCWRAYQG